jgi:3-phenylpropionate/cinnamic acid dioxygenase small subunit
MTTTHAPVERDVRDAVEQFLYLEAELLDDGRFEEWLDVLADDIEYLMPARVTRARGDGSEFVADTYHFEENKYRLRKRIERLGSEYAWAEDPPSRTRHAVSNVRVHVGEGPDEFAVRSVLLLYRSRGETADHDLLSAERHDVVRHEHGGWKLARRVILLDQATVATHNLSVFL